MNDNRLIKHTIFAKIDGKPRKDRPCREWLDDIKDWYGRSGKDLLQLAQDRRMWKKLIRTVVGPNWTISLRDIMNHEDFADF